MKIAILAYYFKPDQSVGAMRPENWARWLGADHQVTVVCPKRPAAAADPADRFRIRFQPSIAVRLLEWANGLRKRRRHRRRVSPTVAPRPRAGTPSGALIYRMPCLHDLWLIPCYRALCRLRPDLIISTHNPYINHVAAWIYRRHHPGTRIWLDYRDLWTGNHTTRGLPLVRALETWMERRILRSAAMVTTVSRHLCQSLAREGAPRVHLVYNSPLVAPPMAGRGRSGPPSRPLVICYTGTIHPGWRNPAPLFELLRDLRRRKAIGARDVRLTVASRHPGNLLSLAEAYEVRDWIDYRGPVSREAAIAMQHGAHVLLLLESGAPEARGVLTGKVFEYLATDKPILLVGPRADAELYQLLQRHERLLDLDRLARILADPTLELPKQRPVDYAAASRESLRRILKDPALAGLEDC
mgnify:CR=1 FL=1